ncbi:hypothetical protein ADUPG1_005474, partial [Aduncisulcus paluster]
EPSRSITVNIRIAKARYTASRNGTAQSPEAAAVDNHRTVKIRPKQLPQLLFSFLGKVLVFAKLKFHIQGTGNMPAFKFVSGPHIPQHNSRNFF